MSTPQEGRLHLPNLILTEATEVIYMPLSDEIQIHIHTVHFMQTARSKRKSKHIQELVILNKQTEV